MQILKEDCPKEEGNDRSLPYTAYVVEYKDKDGGLHYDISISDSTVDIFDHYYDKYKKGFKWLRQSGGTQKPNLWNNKPPQRKKKKRSSAQPPEQAQG